MVMVFLDVDTQRDFIDPEGALPVPGASEIRANLATLTQHARTHGIPVIATACAHTEDDPDPEPFPPHCLVGTEGQGRVTETEWVNTHVIEAGERLRDGALPAHLTVHKRAYDVFTHADFDRIVKLYNENSPLFVVYGVATDYCVKAAVEGLLLRGCRVAIVVDAIRAIDERAEASLLTEWARAGCLLTRTSEICK